MQDCVRLVAQGEMKRQPVVPGCLDALPHTMTRRVNPKELRTGLLLELLTVALGDGAAKVHLENAKDGITAHMMNFDWYRKSGDDDAVESLILQVYREID